jgi:hypothetical protein
LTALQLIDCKLSEKECLPYLEAIIQYSPNLTTLVLDHNPELGSKGLCRLFEIISISTDTYVRERLNSDPVLPCEIFGDGDFIAGGIF